MNLRSGLEETTGLLWLVAGGASGLSVTLVEQNSRAAAGGRPAARPRSDASQCGTTLVQSARRKVPLTSSLKCFRLKPLSADTEKPKGPA